MVIDLARTRVALNVAKTVTDPDQRLTYPRAWATVYATYCPRSLVLARGHKSRSQYQGLNAIKPSVINLNLQTECPLSTIELRPLEFRFVVETSR